MGNTKSYPTPEGDFDSRNDIVLYQICNTNDTIFWKGKSRDELFEQLANCLNQYADVCEHEFRENRAVSISSITVTRHFGPTIPNQKDKMIYNYVKTLTTIIFPFLKLKTLDLTVKSVSMLQGVKEVHILLVSNVMPPNICHSDLRHIKLFNS